MSAVQFISCFHFTDIFIHRWRIKLLYVVALCRFILSIFPHLFVDFFTHSLWKLFFPFTCFVMLVYLTYVYRYWKQDRNKTELGMKKIEKDEKKFCCFHLLCIIRYEYQNMHIECTQRGCKSRKKFLETTFR